MNDSVPWFVSDPKSAGERKHAPATKRNREPIAAVLKDWLPRSGCVVEIASGSGEHVVHFAHQFPRLFWQPSDASLDACRSIAAWSAESGLENIAAPIYLDVEIMPWPVARADALICINMVHIAPWSAAISLVVGAEKLLESGGIFFLYGPWLRDDVETAPGNATFDRSLRERDPLWGLRNVRDMDQLAGDNGFTRLAMVEMPANNLSLIYRRN